MMARLIGASHVWLTEQPELMRIINLNIQHNFRQMGGISASSLYWSRQNAEEFRRENGCPDFVVCGDCIYEPFWGESYRDLLDCFDVLCGKELLTWWCW